MAGLVIDRAMPKVISAKTHGIIDYIHAGTNFLAGALFLRSGNKGAGIGAMVLGAGVLANALMTDYPLGVFRLYSFEKHGFLDYGVAGASAAMPKMIGSHDSVASTFFHVQGSGEALIAGLTNYNDRSGSRQARRGMMKIFPGRAA